MSLINKQLDEFKVNAYHNGEFTQVTRQSLEGHWSVFVFYPADFTFVCPTELGDLADHYQDFKNIGCEVYSVSTDTHFVHKAWADTSDTIKKIQYPMLALRGTFIVNPQGEIKAYEVNDNSIGRDAEELLRKVQAAQFVAEHGDQVCPAKWKPGEQTLSPSLDLVGKL